MSVIATHANGEHALGVLLGTFPLDAMKFLAHVHTPDSITGRGIVTRRVARAAIVTCADQVENNGNGVLRRQHLIAGRETLTAYLENHFGHFIHHGDSQNEAEVVDAVEQILETHTTDLDLVRQNQALLMQQNQNLVVNQVQILNQAFDAVRPPLNLAEVRTLVAPLRGHNAPEVGGSRSLADLFLDVLNHSDGANYQAAVLGMAIGSTALTAYNSGRHAADRSERIGMITSLVGAVAGFFPPAAAPAALALLVADNIRKHFTSRSITQHNSVVDAAYGFVDSLELDAMHANVNNTYASILNTAVRMPT